MLKQALRIAVLCLFIFGLVSTMGSAETIKPILQIISTPSAPLNLVGANGGAKVELTWSPPTDDGGSPITNYKLYRDTTPSPSVLLTTLGNVLAYTDTFVVSGTTYYYVVSAENVVGEGQKSNEISVTVGQYTSHAPIQIDGNGQFISSNGVKNPSATGTKTDPYIIEGWDIDASNGYGIRIQGTSVFFIIRNCSIHGDSPGWDDKTCILFNHVENGTINDNIIFNNDRGIYIESSKSNKISNNNVSVNFYGIMMCSSTEAISISNNQIINNIHAIHLELSTKNTISFNNISSDNNGTGINLDRSPLNMIINNTVSNTYPGLFLQSSLLTKIWGNDFQNAGIELSGGPSPTFQYYIQTITTNNTVNGKPVYYYLNNTALHIDNIQMGQLLLVGCKNATVHHINISNASTGLVIAFSIGTELKNSEFSNDFNSIRLICSNHTKIICNNFTIHSRGIYSLYSTCTNISYNKFTYADRCIDLEWSDSNIIMQNHISNTQNGIFLQMSNENTISYNYVSLNGYYFGIYLGSSSANNYLYKNNVSNALYGIELTNAKHTCIINNNISLNNQDGIRLRDDTSSTTISYNLIFSNIFYGINITQYSSYNRIHHNSLINNNAGKKQAYDDNGTNFWNSSYPSGGNYWSDWTSPDIKKGTNQNQSGSDGIVDSSYLIDGNVGAKDFYPLTTPIKDTDQKIPKAPYAPRNLHAMVNGTLVTLIWNAPNSTGDSSIKNYRICWGTMSGNYTENITIGNVTTYTFINLIRGIRYYFAVSAINTIGEGPKSNETSASIEQQNEVKQQNGESIHYYMFLAAGVIVIVIAIPVFFILVTRRKKTQN